MSAYKWLLIFVTAFLFITCDSLSAQWSKKNDIYALLIVIVLAPFSYYCFGLLNKDVELSAASGLVNMFMIMGTVAVGHFYFEEIISLRQIIGLFFALIAVYLLGYKPT